MTEDDDKTKRYKIQEDIKSNRESSKKDNSNGDTKKMKKVKKQKKEKKHPKLRLFIKIFIILIILLCLAGAGVFAAVFFGDTWNISEDDLVIKMQNSYTYDNEGKVLHELTGEENRQIISLSEMGEYIPKAFVAIEDERFYKHSGIDLYRTAGAIVTYILNGGNSSFGGSTITQQLVKNLTGDTTDSITRKVKEWWKAFLLECYFSKEEILEMYLNIIYVGLNVYGVQTGAKYYFNKKVEDLTLAESAYLAGINNSPNYYNPFEGYDNEEDITDRTLTVLQKMLELGKIDNDEYEEAEKEVNNCLNFDQGNIEIGDCIYSYHTDALINEVIEDLAESKNISEEFAKNYLYLSGSTIYSTQDSSMQDKVEEESLKKQYILYSANGEDTSQAAMVILNHQTGQVLACTGGLRRKRYF